MSEPAAAARFAVIKGLPLALLLALLLQSCTPWSLLKGESLQVMVVTQRKLAWLKRSSPIQRLLLPLLTEFERLHPNVPVSVITVSEDDLVQELRVRTSRGLGPDLILVRAPMANTLLKRGLISPLPNSPEIKASERQVHPRFLARVRLPEGVSGMPVVDEVTLSCYNRAKIPEPPTTTSQLMALAASGRTVGLSIDPYGLWWTTGTMGADQVLTSILLGESQGLTPEVLAQQETTIAAWLAWLRGLALQSRVDLASGPEELTFGLISGRLDWIPCFSLTLSTLKEGMKDRLGVAPLPGGSGGPASPFNTLKVWAFGLDSSASQRRNALALAQLSIDPTLQRRYVLESQEVLPVNTFVQTPVASSGVLAALAAAQAQYEAGSPLLNHPFTVDHLTTVSHQLEGVVQQVMVGLLNPQEGARAIMRLREQAP